jgi:hypothetical protein
MVIVIVLINKYHVVSCLDQFISFGTNYRSNCRLNNMQWCWQWIDVAHSGSQINSYNMEY